MGQCCGKCKTRSQRSRVGSTRGASSVHEAKSESGQPPSANQKLRTDLNSPQSCLAWMSNASQANNFKQENQIISPSVRNDVGCGNSSRNSVEHGIKAVDHKLCSASQQQTSCQSSILYTQLRQNEPLAQIQPSWSLNNLFRPESPDYDKKRIGNEESKQSETSGEPSLQKRETQVGKVQTSKFTELESDKKVVKGASPIVQLTQYTDGAGVPNMRYQTPLRNRPSMNSQRIVLDLPDNFKCFIKEVVFQNFYSQAQNCQKQFAVLLVVSTRDFSNLEEMKFVSESLYLTDNNELWMPADGKFSNYIVSRPENDNYHAEKVILDNLDHLWNAYMRDNRNIPPKCLLFYSWNFPCSKCTKDIIDCFSKPPYKNVSIIMASTAWWPGTPWKKETRKIRHKNKMKMKSAKIKVEEVRPIPYPGDHDCDIDQYTDSDDSEHSIDDHEYYDDEMYCNSD